jgi:hypothetical protein
MFSNSTDSKKHGPTGPSPSVHVAAPSKAVLESRRSNTHAAHSTTQSALSHAIVPQKHDLSSSTTSVHGATHSKTTHDLHPSNAPIAQKIAHDKSAVAPSGVVD